MHSAPDIWLGIFAGRILNLQLGDVKDNPKAHCNSPEGLQYRYACQELKDKYDCGVLNLEEFYVELAALSLN